MLYHVSPGYFDEWGSLHLVTPRLTLLHQRAKWTGSGKNVRATKQPNGSRVVN